ncbi:CTC1 [Branchiostoma lanceolatum]|uniref:CST complex subunit CTC1 n=1 Tax=Branchiostoma lanceolatum TaxID=7740 RepID=A0A8J9ZIZ2_BRALA|nr:CTC1 [Branchiostoma lanceolatum]
MCQLDGTSYLYQQLLKARKSLTHASKTEHTRVYLPGAFSFSSSGVVTSLFQQLSPVTSRLVLPQRQRNIYTEFLSERHRCAPLAGLPSMSEMPPFQVPTVHQLLELVQQQAEIEQNWTIPKGLTPSEPNNALCCTYMVLQPEHFNPPLLLVGQLTSSRLSGELQLQEKTGKVACVIGQSTDAPSYPHLCTDTCQSSVESAVSSCPFAHPWNLNQLIRLDKYQLVVERFIHVGHENLMLSQSDNKVSTTGCDIRISVQFSMCDVVAVLFTGDAVQWYKVLHEGCVYRLVCLHSTDPAVFATKVTSAALSRAVGATSCRSDGGTTK